MAELADALDSDSSGATSCRFKSCYPHQKSTSLGKLVDFYFFNITSSLFTILLLNLSISYKIWQMKQAKTQEKNEAIREIIIGVASFFVFAPAK